MGRYAEIARQHWQKHLPEQFALLEHPNEFFSELEAEAERQIDAMTIETTGVAGSFIERCALYTQQRRTAEEIVVRDLLLQPPTGSAAC